eukprot:s5194_g3.t1
MATAAVLPPPPAETTRCAYVVPNKGRRCRFPVLPGSAMCGAHQENADEGRTAAERVLNGARIPCPLDPNHTVFEKRLKQHLKICTKVRDQSVVESQPFFRRGINLPALAALEAKQSPPTPSTSSTMEPATAREEVVLVEYGSGKGGLAAAALECCPGVRCVLVEREPRRSVLVYYK